MSSSRDESPRPETTLSLTERLTAAFGRTVDPEVDLRPDEDEGGLAEEHAAQAILGEAMDGVIGSRSDLSTPELALRDGNRREGDEQKGDEQDAEHVHRGGGSESGWSTRLYVTLFGRTAVSEVPE